LGLWAGSSLFSQATRQGLLDKYHDFNGLEAAPPQGEWVRESAASGKTLCELGIMMIVQVFFASDFSNEVRRGQNYVALTG